MDVIYTPLDTGTKKDMHSKQTALIKEYKKQNDAKRPKYNKSDY